MAARFGCNSIIRANKSLAIFAKEPVAPSAVPLGDELKSTFNVPRALTEAEIEAIISKFAYSARAAMEWV